MAALIKPITHSDDQLIAMIQNKNTKAFAHLYDKYAAALYGFICKQVDDKKMAEEILQQTFSKIWHSLTDRVTLKNHLLIWMMNVARNITTERKSSKGNYNTNLRLAAV